MKKTIILFIIIGVISGIAMGLYINNNSKKSTQFAKEMEEKAQELKREEIQDKILVDSKETRITPNTKITYKTYYKDCNHILIEEKNVDENLINLTEEELKARNIGEVQKFSLDEVTLYSEKQGYCDEHYILKGINGFLGIYKLDKNGDIGNLIEKTDIFIDLLPEENRKELEDGIKVYSKNELNKIIEDFE